MTQVTLDLARNCLEGTIPAVIATCAADGTPNAAYVSQMQYVDAGHVALTFQFFNKTRENILANPQATALVIDPVTSASFRLSLLYLRTETEGPLFQAMKARLAGIASHTGMAGVFKLRGADIYAVPLVEQIKGDSRPRPPRARNLLHALRLAGERLGECADLGALFDQTLSLLAHEFRISHAMLLVADLPNQRLYTVASRGYGRSGAGAEVALGNGVIGTAARMGTPIRINHATLEYAYSRRMRDELAGQALEREIPLPGLAEPGSQLAVPLACGGQLLGVLFVESPQDMRFGWDDEDALLALGTQVAAIARGFPASADAPDEAAAPPAAALRVEPSAAPLRVRHYEADDSVFLDDDYLIKGVAGAVLWKLLRDHAQHGRTEFTNRELRLAPDIRLPEIGDNLEARLVLLTRRLVDRTTCLRIEKTGRGRFRLCATRPVELVNVPR